MDNTLSLRGDQLNRAFPFHVWVDADLHIRSMGSSLWALGLGNHLGNRLDGLFDIKRPQRHATMKDWLQHGHGLCTLVSKDEKRLQLRGSAEWMDDGSMLLVVAPVVTSMADMQGKGLKLKDFAAHDAAGELLLLGRTMALSADDAMRMAAKSKARLAQIEAMLELCDAGVAYFDADERLRYQNKVLNGLMSFMPGEALGLSLTQFEDRLVGLLSPAETQRNPITELLIAEGAGQNDAVMELRRERPCYAVVQVSLRRSDDGGHVVFIRDVTRETETERMKSDFLSSAAHELRTPMSSILGYAELLLHRPMSEERRTEAMSIVLRQSQLMMRIVTELLDLARIEARQGRDMERKPTPLSRLLKQIAQSQLEAGVSHPLSLPAECPETLLLIDEIKAVQAVAEVLDNARQYSEPGQPVALSIASADDQWLTLEIRDRGVGMSPEEVSRVCERFWRADPSRHNPGTGLGMSLCKEIIDLQGGWMEIDSEPGQGTRVRLSLPVVTVASISGAPMDHNSAIATTKVPPLDAPHPR